MWIGTATIENSMKLPQKVKIGISDDPAIPPLGIYLKKMKTRIQKDTYTPMFIADLL